MSIACFAVYIQQILEQYCLPLVAVRAAGADALDEYDGMRMLAVGRSEQSTRWSDLPRSSDARAQGT